MTKRTFFLTAIILGAVALVIHVIGYDQMAQASSRHALGIQQAYMQHTMYVPDAAVLRLRQTARDLNAVGLVFTFSCVAALAAAVIRHEPGWYSIPILLLFFDVMTQMLL
ncbi:MAG TPA: hypothetical protein VMB80_09830 [Candidatus Acidoferrum sp.]|nr:hypothetical protein [Candidatus Acidoferrum sp.]